jgi:hypothetical protein
MFDIYTEYANKWMFDIYTEYANDSCYFIRIHLHIN